jgi:uncharacterized protein (DUF2062 family)
LPQEQKPESQGPRDAPEPLRARLARRGLSGLRETWALAKREPSSPVEIALSVGVGVFAACTPFLGLHMWIAMGVATLLRLNRVWAFLASRCTFMPIFAGVAFAEIEVAHRIRTGAWLALVPSEAVARAPQLLWDWGLGTLIVGGGLAAAAAGGAYAIASVRRTP